MASIPVIARREFSPRGHYSVKTLLLTSSRNGLRIKSMLRFKCLTALMAALLGSFSGSLCCCVTGQLFGLACCESEHSSAGVAEHRHSCCRHSHSHSTKAQAASEKHEQDGYQSSGCACAHRQFEVLPAIESRIAIAPVWMATLHALALIVTAPVEYETAAHLIRSDQAKPPGCLLFIIHSTFLV